MPMCSKKNLNLQERNFSWSLNSLWFLSFATVQLYANLLKGTCLAWHLPEFRKISLRIPPSSSAGGCRGFRSIEKTLRTDNQWWADDHRLSSTHYSKLPQILSPKVIQFVQSFPTNPTKGTPFHSPSWRRKKCLASSEPKENRPKAKPLKLTYMWAPLFEVFSIFTAQLSNVFSAWWGAAEPDFPRLAAGVVPLEGKSCLAVWWKNLK